MISKIYLFAFLFGILTACQPALNRQPKIKPFATSGFFENQSGARDTVAGTIPFNKTDWVPEKISKDILLGGQKNFDIYCSVCHGLTGHADGMAVQRGFPAPVNFHLLQTLPVPAISTIIASGTGNMPSFSSKLSESDRWAIANYVKVLQLRENFPRDRLSTSDLAELQKEQK